jgi:hypothetical protein
MVVTPCGLAGGYQRRLCFPHWYIGPKPSAIRPVSTRNWNFFGTPSQHNGYSNRKILRIFHPPKTVPSPREDDLTSVTFYPLSVTPSTAPAGCSSSTNTKTACLPPMKTSSFLRPVNCDLALKQQAHEVLFPAIVGWRMMDKPDVNWDQGQRSPLAYLSVPSR